MSLLKDLYRNQTNIDFRRLWRFSTVISGALVVFTAILLLLRGLNLSIDFEGGGVWTVPVADGVTVADGREAAGLADVGQRRMSLGGGLVMWGHRAPVDQPAGPSVDPPARS